MKLVWIEDSSDELCKNGERVRELSLKWKPRPAQQTSAIWRGGGRSLRQLVQAVERAHKSATLLALSVTTWLHDTFLKIFRRATVCSRSSSGTGAAKNLGNFVSTPSIRIAKDDARLWWSDLQNAALTMFFLGGLGVEELKD